MILPAVAPPPPRRPASVTVAFGLQLSLVAVLLALAVLTVLEAVIYDGLIDQAAAATNPDPAEVDGERESNVAFAVIAVLPATAALILFAATAFPVRAGSNVARVLACVGSGIPMLCCAGLGVAAVAATVALGSEPEDEAAFWGEDTPFYDKLYELQSASADGWLTLVIPLLFVLASVMALVVGILLLVPASHRYYRRSPVVALAPGYPVLPGYVLVPVPHDQPPPR